MCVCVCVCTGVGRHVLRCKWMMEVYVFSWMYEGAVVEGYVFFMCAYILYIYNIYIWACVCKYVCVHTYMKAIG